MSSHPARRLAAVAGTGVVLAVMLTGTAAAGAPGPDSGACEAAKARVTELTGDLDRAQRAATEIRTEAAATNLPPVDPDTTQVDPEGDPSGPDGAADVAEGPPLDTDEPAVDPDGVGPLPAIDPDAAQVDIEGDPAGLDGALDTTEGILDTNEAPVDPDGPDGISPAEQREIDRAVRVANRLQRNLDNAIERRNKVCATPTKERPPVSLPGANATVVVCVLKPGTCAEVKVDTEGRLIEIVREHQCDTDRLPTGAVRKGERVTVVNRQVVGDPGSTTTYLAPRPEVVDSGDGYELPAVTG